MPVFEGLLGSSRLLCPFTRQPVEARDGRVVSPAGRDFGPLAGPLNFLRQFEETLDPSRVPRGEVARVRTHLGLPEEPAVDAEIARAIAGTGIRLGEAHLSAEARMLAERFKMPEFQLDHSPPPAASGMGRVVASLGKLFASAPRAEPRLEHVSNTFGALLPAGHEAWRSVRVRNTGGALAAAGASAMAVETRWIDAAGARVANCDAATALPVDLEEGREITLILKLRAPAVPGRYVLQCALTGPGVRGTPFLEAGVDVTVCDLAVFDYEYFPAILDYESDHRAAVQGLDAYLRARAPGRSLDLLEIGGGVHPTGFALATQGHRVLSTDISHSQCILGTLYFRHREPAVADTLAFLSCDGIDMPFADGAFDGVMFYAAFHHFADPRAMLREARRVVRPAGFIFIGCDNCGPAPADPTYLVELRRGINEQVFTLPEYQALFREAGLSVVRARLDSHSIKVVLERADG